MFRVSAILASLDDDLLHAINCELSSPFWNELLPRVQKKEIAVPVFLGLLVVSFFWRRRRAVRAFLTALAAWGTCMGIATILWNTVERQRPWRVHAHLETPEAAATCAQRPDALVTGRGYLSRSPSFPSRHSLTAGVFAAAAWGIARWVGAVTTLFALLVAVGRVWKGVHWPSDVATGLLVGALTAWCVWRCLPAVLGRLGKRHWVEAPAGASSGVGNEDAGQSASGPDRTLG